MDERWPEEHLQAEGGPEKPPQGQAPGMNPGPAPMAGDMGGGNGMGGLGGPAPSHGQGGCACEESSAVAAPPPQSGGMMPGPGMGGPPMMGPAPGQAGAYHGGAPPYGHGVSPPYGHGATPPYGHGATPPYGHGSTPPYGHGATPPYGHGSTPPYGHGAAPPYGHGDTPPYGPGGAASYGYGDAPPYGFQPGAHPDCCGQGSSHGGGMMGHPKFQEHRYGLAGMLTDLAKGNPNWDGMAQWIDSGAGDFWKGALIGAVVALVLTSDTAKGVLGNMWSMAFGEKEKAEQKS